MALNRKWLVTLETTARANYEKLKKHHGTVILLDPTFVYDMNLVEKVEEINKKDYIYIFKLYQERVQARLLENKGYTISNEQSVYDVRKSLTIRIKQINKSSRTYYSRVLSISKNTTKKTKPDLLESLNYPTLKLTLEINGETFNKQKLKVIASKILKQKMREIPINERYKFPKAPILHERNK